MKSHSSGAAESKSSKANQARNGLIMKTKKSVLAFYQWIIRTTMESKDSISITEAPRKQSGLSLTIFLSGIIEPWLLIEIRIAGAQHGEMFFFPFSFYLFFFFFVLFCFKELLQLLLCSACCLPVLWSWNCFSLKSWITLYTIIRCLLCITHYTKC